LSLVWSWLAIGQDATKGSLDPIQCYGNRGPIKQMDKPKIKEVLAQALGQAKQAAREL
jgi:hypothetical protein